MAAKPRVVAELGRPETPDEAAERRAEASRIYRSSQTMRSLVAALLVTLAVVAVIVFAVPRGEFAPREPLDVAAIAADLSEAEDRTLVVPEVPSSWTVNAADIEGEDVRAWTIVYVPDATSFLRVAQGFDADASWPSQVLDGADSDGTVDVAGVTWDVYEIADPAATGNVSYALATAAGADTIMIYGSADADTAAVVAAGVADQVRELEENG